jgi:hypothetical protein
MDLKMRKERIITWVKNLEDENMLDKLEMLSEDSEEVYVLSSREEELLLEAVREVDSGNFSTHEDVQKRVKEWLYK